MYLSKAPSHWFKKEEKGQYLGRRREVRLSGTERNSGKKRGELRLQEMEQIRHTIWRNGTMVDHRFI